MHINSSMYLLKIRNKYHQCSLQGKPTYLFITGDIHRLKKYNLDDISVVICSYGLAGISQLTVDQVIDSNKKLRSGLSRNRNQLIVTQINNGLFR
jgi:hypothetical protein